MDILISSDFFTTQILQVTNVLSALRDEIEDDTVYAQTMSMLAGMTQNLAKSPDAKFRQMTLANKVFHERVGRYVAAMAYLRAIGFTEAEDEQHIVLDEERESPEWLLKRCFLLVQKKATEHRRVNTHDPQQARRGAALLDSIGEAVESLQEACEWDEFLAVATALEGLIRNLVKDPAAAKYRRINTANKVSYSF